MLILVPPAVFRGNPAPLRFDDRHLLKLQALKPDYVFVGSSTLLSRIDTEQLNRLRPGSTSYILGEVGSMSALWYLWVKNSLLPSGVRPRVLFIHFRDTELTDPVDETGSLWNQERIARNKGLEDADFGRISHHHKRVTDRLREWLIRFYPIQERGRKPAFWMIDGVGFLLSSPAYRGYLWNRSFYPERIKPGETGAIVAQRATFKARLAEEIFSNENQRVLKTKGGKGGEVNARHAFDARLEHSFLPELIRLGRQGADRVIFVRMEPRPAVDDAPPVPHPSLDHYMAALRAHLERERVGFHDFSDEKSLKYDMYLDGGHVKPEFMPFYTERFVERLAEAFR
ncbi:MAG: hypothetical protein H7834_12280 [Magnetococcus sp. YQC-9]